MKRLSAEFAAGEGRYYGRLQLADGTDYPGEIRKLTMTAAVNGSTTELQLGAAPAASLRGTLETADAALENQQVTVWLGRMVNDELEEVKMGVYTITETTVKEGVLEITGYDAMVSAMEQSYEPSDGLTTAGAVLHDICAQAGLTLSLPEACGDVSVSGITGGYTRREMAAYMAALLGGNACINSEGQMSVKWYDISDFTVDGDSIYSAGLSLGDEALELNRIDCSSTRTITGVDGTGNTTVTEQTDIYSAGGGSACLSLSNPWMTQEILDGLWEKIGGMVWYSGSVSMLGDLRWEAGDLLSVEDENGVSHPFPVMQVSHEYDGGLKTTLSSYGKSATDSKLNTSGALGQAVERVTAKLAAFEQVTADNLSATTARIENLSAEKVDLDLANIEDGVITTAMIADASITNAKIRDVSADKLTAGTIDAGSITVVNLNADNITAGTINGERIGEGAVTTEKLAENAVTAAKLAVGDFTNYTSWKDKTAQTCPFTDFGSGWSISTGTYRTAGASYRYTPSSLTVRTLGTIEIPVQAGEQLYVEFYYKTSGNWSCVPSASKLRIGAEDGTLLAGFSVAAEAQTEWTRISGVYQVDERAGAYVQVTILMQAAALPENGAYIWLDDFTISKRLAGELIVDGSITAEKLAVNSVTAENGAIAALAVTDANIASLDAEKISSGTLDAERIGADSITAEKLTVGDFTNYASWKDKTAATSPFHFYGAGWSISTGTYRTAIASYRYRPTSTEVKTLGTILIPVQAGEQIYVEFYYKTSDNWVGTDGACGLRITASDGADLTLFPIPAAVQTEWTRVSGVYEVTQESGAAVSVAMTMQSAQVPDAASYIWVDDITIRKMTDGGLIVNGSVTTEKLSAAAVTADKIDVMDLFAQDIMATGSITGLKLKSTDLTFYAEGNEDAEEPSGQIYFNNGICIKSAAGTAIYLESARGIHMENGPVYVNSLVVNGVDVPVIRTGSVTGLTVAAGSYLDQEVSFGYTYSSPPKVFVTLSTTSTSPNMGFMQTSVLHVTTTGCTVRLYNTHTALFKPSVQWMAVG